MSINALPSVPRIRPSCATTSPALLNVLVSSPVLFLASVVVFKPLVSTTSQSVNLRIRGSAAESNDKKTLYRFPATLPSFPIVSLLVPATVFRFFKLSASVTTLEKSIADCPSAFPVSPNILLSVGNKLVTKLPTAVSSAGKRSLPAEAFNSSNLGLRSAMYLAKLAASSDKPAVASAPPPPPPPFPALALSSSFFALAVSIIAFF